MNRLNRTQPAKALRGGLRVSAATMVALALTFGTVAASPSANAAAGTKPAARTDRAAVKAGNTTSVNVLANDTVTVKTRAKVRVLRVSGPVRARVTGKNIAVRALPKAKAGTYRVKYRVSDVRGKRSTAVILVRVSARRGSNTGETPGNNTPSLPSVMERPGAPVVTNITCQAVGSEVTMVVYHWQVSGGRYTHYDPATHDLTRITDGQTITGVASKHVRLPIATVRANLLNQIISDSYQQFIAPLNWVKGDPSGQMILLSGNPQPSSEAAHAAITNC